MSWNCWDWFHSKKLWKDNVYIGLASLNRRRLFFYILLFIFFFSTRLISFAILGDIRQKIKLGMLNVKLTSTARNPSDSIRDAAKARKDVKFVNGWSLRQGDYFINLFADFYCNCCVLRMIRCPCLVCMVIFFTKKLC